MGNSTGSMLYLFVIVIVLWIVGASVYTLIQWLKKRRSGKKGGQTDQEREEIRPDDGKKPDKEE